MIYIFWQIKYGHYVKTGKINFTHEACFVCQQNHSACENSYYSWYNVFCGSGGALSSQKITLVMSSR